jgi:gliding motility-associated-like protein
MVLHPAVASSAVYHYIWSLLHPLPQPIKHIFYLTAVLFFSRTGYAQLCTGSLGDPVVNITFGSGSNPGPPLPSATTNYTYLSNQCPNDGFYTITNQTVNCFSSTWHSVIEDHTPGDVNGYMMLVNASFNPGVFYLDTVRDLCGGTTYEFSAWIMSVLKSSACNGTGNTPNITFSIETTTGTVIQSYSTGSIANLSFPQWNQYGFFFTLPGSTSNLVLRLINTAPGGCGNDLALDDITFRPCGPKVNAAFVNANGNSDTANYCISDNKSITINGSVQSGYNNPSFQWQQSTDSGRSWYDIPGETSTSYTHTYNTAGVFQYRMSAAETGNIGIAKCRVASNALTIGIDAIPVPQASNTSPVCERLPVTLNAKNGNLYAWTGPNGFSSALASPLIPLANLQQAGKYYVVVSSRGGCTKQDSTLVVVNALPAANAGADTAICEKRSVALQASGGILYAWLPTTGLSDASVANPVANPLVTTTYAVQVTNQYNCKAADSVLVTVLKLPIANAGPDKKTVAGQPVQLNGSATGDTSSYFWTPSQFISNAASKTPFVTPPADIVYTFHVVSGNGCGASADEVFVRVLKKITVPNAFSPNGDGINDTWVIEALDSYPESETQVFNRYGQLVFRSQGYTSPWNGTYNGKPLASGTYYYKIDRKNDFPLMSGWVMILR